MTALLLDFLAPLAPYVVGLLAVIGALFWGKAKGKADAQKAEALRNLTDYKDTSERISDETASPDAAAARGRLRERAGRKP